MIDLFSLCVFIEVQLYVVLKNVIAESLVRELLI